jgi:hypoxanthine phosphoribosyltransferase
MIGDRTCYSAQQIGHAVLRIANGIDAWADRDPVVLLGVLQGGLPFLVDLSRAVTIPHHRLIIETMIVKRYRSAFDGASPTVLNVPSTRVLHGKRVVIVDDIADEGVTMRTAVEACMTGGALSVRTAAMIVRPGCPWTPEWYGFLGTRDAWYFGYGMDDEHGTGRGLPFIATRAIEQQGETAWPRETVGKPPAATTTSAKSK